MCHSLKVDSKGRLKIPTNLLAAGLGTGNEFYVTSDHGNFVRIYPIRVWKAVEGQLERLCAQNEHIRRLLSWVKYFGQSVKIDKQGRLLIPTLLRKRAQIKGGVHVLNYTNHLEVWNHYRLLRHLKSSRALRAVTLDGLISARRSPLATVRKNQGDRVPERDRRFVVHRRPLGNSNSSSSHAIRGARMDRSDRAEVA